MMGDCSHELQLEHTAKIATIETEIENIKVAVSDFSVIKDTLIKLEFLSEQSVKFNETQLKSNEEVKTTLYNINENLNKLNGRVDNLEKTEEIEKVSATELRVENSRERSARFKAKFTFYGVIASCSVTVILFIATLLLK